MLRRFAVFALVFAASAAGATTPEKKPSVPGKCDGLFDKLEERQREALKHLVGDVEGMIERGEMTRAEIEEAVLRWSKMSDQASVIGHDPEGFTAKIESLDDIRYYQMQIMDGIWVVLREKIFDPSRTKIFYHSMVESKIFPKPLRLLINDLSLAFQNPSGRVSTRGAASIHHMQAAVTTHAMLTPEKLWQSFQQLHDIGDVQTQREWIAVALLEEAATWPQRRAMSFQSTLLNLHMHDLAVFDEKPRRAKVNFATPYQIFENIVLTKIWLDHHISYLKVEESSEGTEARFTYDADKDIEKQVHARLLEDVITAQLNLFEIWKNRSNLELQKQLEVMMVDARHLAEALYVERHPDRDTLTAPELQAVYDIEQKIRPVVEVEPEPVREELTEPEEIAAMSLAETFETTLVREREPESATALPTLPVSFAPLHLGPDGSLSMAQLDAGSGAWVLAAIDGHQAAATQRWTVRLTRDAQKEWKLVARYADNRSQQFFERMNRAFATILSSGYYASIGQPGFPYVKNIRGGEDVFEFLLGNSRRVIYHVDAERRELLVTSFSAHHKVSY
ncbi:MAG TPA: hypothetical protein VM901_09815 [Bdellovibrionota bacterium]|jgi:hypothetical protein|nr:hypothetical protein [Bdellovibrionota bacterium]